jgi:AcrR family transcriptional regulator
MDYPPAIIEKTKSEQKDGKRARLLAAALDLFECRGFDGVAVPEIAGAASVAVGTVYRYFETKEALFNALFHHWHSAYNEFALAPPPRLNARDAFGFRWQRIMLFARTNPRPMRFLVLHHHAPHLDAANENLVAADREIIARDLASVPSMPPILAAALMWGAMAGLLKYAEEGRHMLDATTAAEMEDALWRAIAG